jgi:hypothetical protein
MIRYETRQIADRPRAFGVWDTRESCWIRHTISKTHADRLRRMLNRQERAAMTDMRNLTDEELNAILTDDSPVDDERLEAAGNERDRRAAAQPMCVNRWPSR